MINCLVNLNSQNTSSLITCLYGALNESEKTRKWNHLNALRATYPNPWIVIGDLNFILHNDEKEGGNQVSQSELEANNMLLNINNLSSMPYIGNPFTLTNRRDGNEFILERLYIAVLSYDWTNIYINVALYHLTVVGSDHFPIMLLTSKMENSTKKPFRVNKAWFRDLSCTEIIKSEWKCNQNGSPAFLFTHCLRNTKFGLRNWNYHHFGNINTQISNL
ncbi:uncharacterized protein LOC113279456 [Papaver somniferum]|uniref:uncharacterized protein LOC113279456 n=1 Tax=Papaver somniferum TaxID=3469 RepID=UPI000E6FF0D4|nr:uncharacterized protein LOC113279456 [Papaver somniferum]